VIALNNVTKSYVTRYGKYCVFRDITITLPENRNIGIIGPNGAGKTTLLRMIGKMDFPDRGEVVVTKKTSWPVGLIAGSQGSMTGRDNTLFVCRIQGIKNRASDRYVSFVQDFADIGKHFDLPVKTYSAGMRARLNFGISMAFEFDLYLVDEVTAVGDMHFKKKSKAVFAEKRKKANLIMVSHNMGVIRENCDVGVLVNKGKIEVYENINDAIKIYSKL